MKVLIALTYFEPYKSGLSVYALRLAKGLTELGHEVVVISSQYRLDLALDDTLDGIKLVRVPVWFRLSKGVVMPSLSSRAREWVEWADIVNLHLPQFESSVYARLANRFGKKLLVTYHCNLNMTGGWLNRLAGKVTTHIGRQVLRQAHLIVQNSLDYAENSPSLKPFLNKVKAVPTPVELIRVPEGRVNAFKLKYGIQSEEKILGLAGRVASEKGYEYLVEALPLVRRAYPSVRVLHAGMWKGVMGEEAYQARVEALVKPLGDHWKSLGFLSDEDFRAFFGACDLLVFSSLNSTESFGIVQIEAMLQGTPVVASDLPGVRQPVLQTGFGRVVPIRDSQALAQAIISVLDEGKKDRSLPAAYLETFSQENVAQQYDMLMKALVQP
ncbi:MAG: glycosyltransferase family 4 protein [Anaerolineaceae bacterium]